MGGRPPGRGGRPEVEGDVDLGLGAGKRFLVLEEGVFAVAVHPRDADTAWFVPAVKDEKRYPVDARLVVARTRDGRPVTARALQADGAMTVLLRDALLENIHRSQLNPLEEAAAYRQLLDDFSCTQDELSARIGRSRPQISNTLRLMKLPPAVQRRVAAGVLSSGHARALLGLQDDEQIEELAARIVAEGLLVHEPGLAAALVRSLL